MHLRSADFLDVENHPQVVFRSTRVDGAHGKEGDRFKVAGDLEIRGKSMPVTLDATFEGIGTDPWVNSAQASPPGRRSIAASGGCDGTRRSSRGAFSSRTA
jgi:polyisoprenoid-binding protein YceI